MLKNFIFTILSLLSGCSNATVSNTCGSNGQYSSAMRSDGIQTYCSYVVIVVGFRGCPEGFPHSVALPGLPASEPGMVVCSNRLLTLDNLPPSVQSDARVESADAGIDLRTACSNQPSCAQADGLPTSFSRGSGYRRGTNGCFAAEYAYGVDSPACCFSRNGDIVNWLAGGTECSRYYATQAQCQAVANMCTGVIQCGTSALCLPNEVCAWDCDGWPTGRATCVPAPREPNLCATVQASANGPCSICNGAATRINDRNYNCYCE